MGAIELDKPSKTVFLKLNPLALLSGTIPVYSGELRGVAEIVASERATYSFGGSFLYKSPIFEPLLSGPLAVGGNNDRLWGYRFQTEFRYYYLKFTNKKKLSKILIPSGLYASLHGSYASAVYRDRDNPFPYYEFLQVDANVLVGMQVMISDAVGLDMFTGLGYKNYAITRKIGSNSRLIDPVVAGFFEPYYWPIKFKLGTALVFGLL
ncbi:MAG: hypothetical protein Salg2KO_17130 [Salibacteraceae bacterium]